VKHKEPLLLFHQDGAKFRRAPDVLVAMNGGTLLLFENDSGRGNHWLGLKLEGVTGNRDAIGARMRWSAGGVVRSRLKNSGGS
jgi:enediyne biosynthesis protein E4